MSWGNNIKNCAFRSPTGFGKLEQFARWGNGRHGRACVVMVLFSREKHAHSGRGHGTQSETDKMEWY
jgi:hypothetical protein